MTTQFPHRIICADQLYNDLLVATNLGVFRINIGAEEEGRSWIEVFPNPSPLSLQ